MSSGRTRIQELILLADTIERRTRLALASLFFHAMRTRPLGADTLKALGPSPNILVVRQQNQMGDMLLTTPCFRALRESLPGSWITLVASDENEAVVRSNPHLDEVVVYRKTLFRRNPAALLNFLAAVRKRRYDVGIVISTVSLSVTSVLICLASRARCRVGFSGSSFGMGFVDRAFHAAFPILDPDVHQTRLALSLLENLGVHTQDLSPIMVPSSEAEAFAREFMSGRGLETGEVAGHTDLGAGPVVGIHPGAGKNKNRWPASGFASVSNALRKELGARILVIGGPADSEAIDTMLSALDFKPVLLSGESLDRVAAVIKRLSLFICNDTGVLHVSAAVGCPTLSLFGPTDPSKWAPLSGRVTTLRASDSDLKHLGEDKVLEAARERLARSES